MGELKAIALDADDTLWHNERAFRLTQERFAELLSNHGERAVLDSALQAAERRNLGRYGFGVKGFVLSMIETALEVTDNTVPGEVIAELLDAGRDMLAHPVELLDGVADTVQALGETHPLMLITKGDLLDQERKLAASGLGELFSAVEVVSDKTPEIYGEVMARHRFDPEAILMCGNSMKSDVLPMLEIGGWGVFIPQELAWDFEHADPPEAHDRFFHLTSITALPATVLEIEDGHMTRI